MRIGRGAFPWEFPSLDKLVDAVVEAEQLGFSGLWLTHIIGSVDALTALALAGQRTSRIELGTFVVPTYPHHPSALAQQALTTQAACGNRLTLGIGVSHRVVMEGRLGIDFSRPVGHMREYLACLTPLLRGEPVTPEGREFHLHDARVTVPGASAPPVLVAALGPQMLRLAGRMSDGTAVWMGGPRYLKQHAVPAIDAAAREAGRPAPRVLAGLPVCVTDDPPRARLEAAKAFARYGELPSYRAILDKEGDANPEDVALIGSTSYVRASLRALDEAGVTDFAAVPYVPSGEDTRRTIEVLLGYAR
jgi:F420-dependent oxidoreductase-like protein